MKKLTLSAVALALALFPCAQDLAAGTSTAQVQKEEHEGHDHDKEKGAHKDEHGHEGHGHEGQDHSKETSSAKDAHADEGHDHAKEKKGSKKEDSHDGHNHAKEKGAHKDEHGHEAHEDGEGHEANANVGPGKAVEAFDEGGKLQLSPQAVSRLGLKSTAFQGSPLPRVALVQSEGKTYVYIDKGGRRYERRAVELGTASGKTVTLRAGVKQGEKVVTSGASSLRVTELDLMAGDEAGHDH